MASKMLSTVIVANMTPVLTDDPAYLHHYAYALNIWADVWEAKGCPLMANEYRRRAYHMRTLAR